MQPITITVAEFCRITGVGRTSAFSLLAEGTLERIKVGRRTLITMRSVDAWIDRSTAEAAAERVV